MRIGARPTHPCLPYETWLVVARDRRQFRGWVQASHRARWLASWTRLTWLRDLGLLKGLDPQRTAIVWLMVPDSARGDALRGFPWFNGEGEVMARQAWTIGSNGGRRWVTER